MNDKANKPKSISIAARFRRALRWFPNRLKHIGHELLLAMAAIGLLVATLSIFFTIPYVDKGLALLTKSEHLFAKILVVLLLFTVIAKLLTRFGPIWKPSNDYLIEARRAQSEADISAIAEIADYYYSSTKLGGLDGRKEYFERLLSGNNRCLWVMSRLNENHEEVVVGYTSVLPLRQSDENALGAHLSGKLSQYSFRPSDLYPSDEVVKGVKPELYVQAICIHPDYSGHTVLRAMLRHVLNIHFVDLMCQFENDDLVLYVEEFEKLEHSFFKSRGFVSTEYVSLDGHRFHSWPPQDSDRLTVGGVFMKNMIGDYLSAYRVAQTTVKTFRWHL